MQQWSNIFFWGLMTIVGAAMLSAGDQKTGLLFGRIKVNARIAGYVWICLGLGVGGLRVAGVSGWADNSLLIFFGVTAGCVAAGILLGLLHNRSARRKEAAAASQPSPPPSLH